MKRRSIARSAWLPAVAALTIALGACGKSPDEIRSAVSSESYALSDFTFVYPYEDPRRDVRRIDRTSVLFTVNWPSSGFPGYADCTLSLEGGGGQVVGDLTFQLISGTDGARGAPLIIPVSGEPAAVGGSCTDEGTEDTSGSGYFFTGPTRIWALAVEHEGLPGRDGSPSSQVEFEVAWEHPGQNPGMRTCHLHVTRADGTEDAPAKYGMLVGEGPLVFDVEGEPETIASARVTCGQLED